MVDHTFYDKDLWKWCPNPQKFTQLKEEGIPILDSIKEELKGVIGSVPFSGGEFHESDIAIALAILSKKLIK